MSTLKVIFNFILSVVKIIFPGKNNGRHCHPDHPVPDTHRPDRPVPEGDGGGTGSGGSHPVGEAAGEEKPPPSNPSGRLMGQALIATAIIGYLYKMFVT